MRNELRMPAMTKALIVEATITSARVKPKRRHEPAPRHGPLGSVVGIKAILGVIGRVIDGVGAAIDTIPGGSEYDHLHAGLPRGIGDGAFDREPVQDGGFGGAIP